MSASRKNRMSCFAACAPMLRAAPGPWLRLSFISLTLSGCLAAYWAIIDGVLSDEPLSTTVISISASSCLRSDSIQSFMCLSSLYDGMMTETRGKGC